MNENSINPFFQTVVYRNENFSFDSFEKSLDKKVKELNKKKNKNLKRLDKKNNSNCIVYVYSLKELPTWYKEDILVSSSHKIIEESINKELILVILKSTKNYIFFHCTNNMVNDFVDNLFYKELKIRKIDVCSIYNVLDDSSQVRTLGLNNTFGAGGSAPEAKAYYGKETQNSLSISFDSGYSFSYCLASKIKDDKKKTSIGCSTSKRKIWGTWTEGISDFSKQCDILETQLQNNSETDLFPVLVKPVNNVDVSNLEIVNLYIDCVIPRKGMLLIDVEKKVYSDWIVTYPDGYAQIEIDTPQKSIIIKLEFKIENNKYYKFKYKRKSKTAKILISDNEDEYKGKKRKDLVDFLNEQGVFTIIFNDGFAYRDETFWKDNRLTKIYKKSLISMSWDNVDITKESSKSKQTGMINISERVTQFVKEEVSDLLYIIDDDSANEIADHIVITKNKIILIHDKFSSKVKSGLRIDDLQVVIAQAMKNIRFYLPISYENKYERMLKNLIYPCDYSGTKEQLISEIRNSIINIDEQNECWIVQPGISKDKLEKGNLNKAHTLLNYVDGICKNNNIMFKFYCNK
jgi:hypothetical protein